MDPLHSHKLSHGTKKLIVVKVCPQALLTQAFEEREEIFCSIFENVKER